MIITTIVVLFALFASALAFDPFRDYGAEYEDFMESCDQLKDLYCILGVPSTASAAEIRQSYLQLSKRYKVSRDASDDYKQMFTEIMQVINDAYDILKDSTKRQHYDAAAQDISKNGPIHQAVEDGNVKLVRRMLNYADAGPNDRGQHYRTPLHYAVMGGNEEMVLCLLDAGADVDLVDDEGLTPLHLAVQSGDVDIIRVLLKNDANPYAEDANGQTPIAYAVESGADIIILQMLIQRTF